jgi:hypothetical protein
MTNFLKLLTELVAIVGLGLTSALAAGGSWKFEPDSRDNPILTYSENGTTIFQIGCGRAFGLEVRYPGVARTSGKASVTLATSRDKMTFDGEFHAPTENSQTNFVQWDLGFARQDPKLYGKRWNTIKSRLLDLIASGEPLKLSAGKSSYQLPSTNITNWKEPLQACGE